MRALALPLIIATFLAGDHGGSVRVQGPGGRPQIGFACCEGELSQASAMLDDPRVVSALRQLDAQVAIPVLDFTTQRAELVRKLEREGVPVIAWLTLSQQDGLYMNAYNEPLAEQRVWAFEDWSRHEHLNWAAVGLDIEPNFAELAALKTHKMRLISTLMGRAVNGGRLAQARRKYNALIGRLQADGYVVQTYLMPYVPAERSVDSTMLDRILGSVDVHSNQEYLMLYTSIVPQVGAGMIWSLGRKANGIAVGSTEATGGAPGLNWDEFSRDLVVASHFSKQIGIYNLEGCVQQNWLPQLASFDWSQTVTIPAASVERAERMGLLFRIALWTLSHAVYLAGALVALAAWLIYQRRTRRRKRKASAIPSPKHS